MRRKIIAGNWKMNLDHNEGAALARKILEGLDGRNPSCELILFPPFTTLPAVAEVLAGSDVGMGAQDLWYADEGAFTGEISGRMLSAIGCRYVLVGHSERRHILGESSPLLSKKLRAALEAGLTPIYCVGETLEERESGIQNETVSRQIGEVLEGSGARGIDGIVVAYEPVWAIGTGRTASPGDASSMHAVIRSVLRSIFGGKVSDEMPILYGGSVKAENARELLSAPDIDGALVGGASLKADSFLGIVFPG